MVINSDNLHTEVYDVTQFWLSMKTTNNNNKHFYVVFVFQKFYILQKNLHINVYEESTLSIS